MKSFKLFAISVVVALSSCGDAFNPSMIRATVNKDFPDCEVQVSPYSKFQFIIRREDGSVAYVEYMGSEMKPTAIIELFKPLPTK